MCKRNREPLGCVGVYSEREVKAMSTVLTDSAILTYTTQLDAYAEQVGVYLLALDGYREQSTAVASKQDAFERQPSSECKLEALVAYSTGRWGPLYTGFANDFKDLQKFTEEFQTLRATFKETYLPTGSLDDITDADQRHKIGDVWMRIMKGDDSITRLNTAHSAVSATLSRLNERLTTEAALRG